MVRISLARPSVGGRDGRWEVGSTDHDKEKIMSHLILNVTLSTDGDAVTELVESLGAPGAVAVHLNKISEQLHAGRTDSPIVDANGNTVGHWYLSAFVDGASNPTRPLFRKD